MLGPQPCQSLGEHSRSRTACGASTCCFRKFVGGAVGLHCRSSEDTPCLWITVSVPNRNARISSAKLTLADAQCFQDTINEELSTQLFPTRLDFVYALAVVGHLSSRWENLLVIGVFDHCCRVSRQMQILGIRFEGKENGGQGSIQVLVIKNEASRATAVTSLNALTGRLDACRDVTCSCFSA